MNEFTLFAALNAVKKHFLVTIVLFGLTLWLIPSMNLIDNRYSMEKTIILGESDNGYLADLLGYSDIHAILSSANIRVFLGNNTDGTVARFHIDRNEEKNIVLVLKHHNRDTIFETATLIMERLQEFDELQIQKQLSRINEDVAQFRDSLKVVLLSDEQYEVTNSDIEEFVSKQKNFEAASSSIDIDRQNVSDIFGLTRLKREDTTRKVEDELKVIELEKNIMRLEGLIEKGFKKVSYLFPLSPQEISRYYPNQMIFFGISLLVALLYNLIMLNILYIKNSKKV